MLRDRRLWIDYVNAEALPSWPVTWGAPLLPGELTGAESLALRPDGTDDLLPVQWRVLTRHGDGSARDILIHAEPGVAPESRSGFVLTQRASSARASTASVDAPAWFRWDGQSLRVTAAAGEVALSIDAVARAVTDADVADADVPGAPDAQLTVRPREPEIFESGPLLHAGVFGADLVDPRTDEALLDLRLTVRRPALTPILQVDVFVKNQSDHAEIEIDRLHLVVTPVSGDSFAAGESAWTTVGYEIRQLANRMKAPAPMRARSDRLRIETQTTEGASVHARRLLNYNETWFAGDGRFTLGIRSFFEMFPLGIAIEPATMTAELWPAWSSAARLRQGAGRTHELVLGWANAAPVEGGLTPEAIGWGHGKPPMPRVDLSDLQHAGEMTELLAYQPDQYPRVEMTIYDLVHNRNRGYGKMHWGDDYSMLYTNQLRGHGEVVWNNLEGDLPYHLLCLYQRTGRFAYYKQYVEGLRHWADVDFRDRFPDPLHSGALVAHTADHTRDGMTTPCHNWAESFAAWWRRTGDPRPLEILAMMADWLVRREEAGFFATDPQPYVRGCGWGLIQMAAIYRALGDPRIRAMAFDLADRLLAYQREQGGLTMLLPTGGAWTRRDNAFHTATVVLGAEQWLHQTGDHRFRSLAVELASVFHDERTCTPEGVAVYITGPEQDFPMQQAAGFAMAALAVAWRLTGDASHVRRGMRMLEYCLDRGMIVDHMRIPGEFIEIGEDLVLNVPLVMPNCQLLSYQLRGLNHFMRAAHETGLLKAIDYRF